MVDHTAEATRGVQSGGRRDRPMFHQALPRREAGETCAWRARGSPNRERLS
jgi:hypothetical protein